MEFKERLESRTADNRIPLIKEEGATNRPAHFHMNVSRTLLLQVSDPRLLNLLNGRPDYRNMLLGLKGVNVFPVTSIAIRTTISSYDRHSSTF